MNKGQQKILAEMQGSTDVIHTIDAKDAVALAADGYVRTAKVSPAPDEGKTAVNLTVKGRSFKNVDVTPEPETDAPTD